MIVVLHLQSSLSIFQKRAFLSESYPSAVCDPVTSPNDLKLAVWIRKPDERVKSSFQLKTVKKTGNLEDQELIR